MENKINMLAMAMIEFDKGDPKRIQHFLKVHAFSKIIAEKENLDEHTQFILEAAALTHDIWILPSEKKYGKCNGKLQEQEGPIYAEKMLKELDFNDKDIERICYLIGHHHTYTNVDGLDYRILLEADALVNIYEDEYGRREIDSMLEKVFKTKSGIEICNLMFEN